MVWRSQREKSRRRVHRKVNIEFLRTGDDGGRDNWSKKFHKYPIQAEPNQPNMYIVHEHTNEQRFARQQGKRHANRVSYWINNK